MPIHAAPEIRVARDADFVLRVDERFHAPVLDALERLMERSLSGGDTGLAMRAGRALHGVAVQGDYKDLQGPRPRGMGSARSAAAWSAPTPNPRSATQYSGPA